MVKYATLNPISQSGLSKLPETYKLTENVDESDVILVRSAVMHDMEFSDNLKAIARAGAGVNNIPLDKAADKGIVVFNTPGANANGVKELVIGGLMLAARDVIGGVEWVKANASDANIGKAMEKAKKNFAGHEIAGKKLGVIGLGAIGVLVANAANSLGMEVIGCDPYLSVSNALHLSRSVKIVKTREEIFSECDYITVHVPLLDDTKKMINKETIAQMKDGVVILNYARDLLVDDDAMEEALNSGKVAKYLTDIPNAKTANMKNVIATPHLGASTEEAEDNCASMAADEVVDFIENGNITNSVNYPAVDVGKLKVGARICICHKNIPNMLTQFTSYFAETGVNIETMVNKSRGEYAYSVLDVATTVTDKAVEKIKAINGVLKVRVITK
jgi:D-3-phosphoglycerate dehydrogenase